MKQYLAIDVGGTSTKYALVSEQGELAEKHKQPTARNSRAEFMAAMTALIHRYQGQIAGVGLALPGVVNQQQGIVKTCAALPFLETIPLAARLKDAAHLNMPVVIGNDGNAAALAEHWQGKLVGTINSAMIVLGTGVGAALFLNGTLYTGSHDVSGEPSFMITNGLNPITRAQTAAGLSAVKTVNAMAAAQHIRGYNIQTVLDLEKIVIGGGISVQSRVIDEIRARVATYMQVTPLAARTIKLPEIVAAKYRNDANLVGAVVPLVER